jgi:hypothetical protein
MPATAPDLDDASIRRRFLAAGRPACLLCGRGATTVAVIEVLPGLLCRLGGPPRTVEILAVALCRRCEGSADLGRRIGAKLLAESIVERADPLAN